MDFFVDHVVKKVKNLIDQGLNSEVTYAIQVLSRVNQKDVYKGFKKIDGELAEWFTGLVESSPKFAIDELYRLFTYTGGLYPKLTAAVNNQKFSIIKNILKQISNDRDMLSRHTILRNVTDLLDMGFDWPELTVIHDGLKKDAVR